VIDNQPTAWSNLIVQALDRSLGRCRALDHAEANDDVKLPAGTGECRDVGLPDPMHGSERKIFDVGLDRSILIDGSDARATVQQHFGKSAGTAAAFEDVESWQNAPEPFTQTTA
jgi:hypothetical protein